MMDSIQVRGMPFYDLRGCDAETNVPRLLIGWIKRKRGIVMKASSTPTDESTTFTLVVKMDFRVDLKPYIERPVFPDCEFTFDLNEMD